MGKKILVIDDDEQVRNIIQEQLERAGYQVFQAADGKAGVRMFQQESADAVITDIYMPEQEGLQTVMEVKAISPDTPIIAISGGTEKIAMDFLPAAQNLGAVQVLRKPFSSGQLLDAVRSALQAPRTPPKSG